MGEGTISQSALMRSRLEREWQHLMDSASRDVRDLLLATLQENSAELRDRYLAYLDEDEAIATVLGERENREEFTRIFLRGVFNLLDPRFDSAVSFYDQQAEIGALMSRVGLPPYALSRAMRKLTIWLVSHLTERQLSQAILVEAVIHIVETIGLSIEIREISYQEDVETRSRIDEAYRLYSLGQNLAIEREHQRALLMEWAHSLLTAFHQVDGPRMLPKLWSSEFGLWLNHKARFMFEKAPPLPAILSAVDQIDRDLVPALEKVCTKDQGSIAFLITHIEEQLSAIRFGLNSIFDLHIAVEKGRDPLTQLLGRQFMPSIMIREIELQKSLKDQGLCLLLIDIDHFKAINDLHGHKAGDVALRHVAQAITDSTRPSDFVFRYGGEEIIVLLTDCARDTALQTAERIREGIEGLLVSLPEGGELLMTVSIGVAAHAGEFDYEALIARADKAMYRAKSSGKNRVALG